MTDFSVIIPARYQSSRLTAKLLLPIGDQSVLERTYRQACNSSAKNVIIATDDARIAHEAKRIGAQYCMTSSQHPSGTDRLQEVVTHYGFNENHSVVNVQGDEPFMPPEAINQVALALKPSVTVATLSETITDARQLFDPSCVKVVTDNSGFALYFSRAPLPWARDEFAENTTSLPNAPTVYQRHLGIYAYRVAVLHRFVRWPEAPLERLERLEQLRLLWHGERIYVATSNTSIPPGIDTQADYEHACLRVKTL